MARGAVVWLGARFMVVALSAAVRGSTDSQTAALFAPTNPIIAAFWTLALSATLIHLDLHRRHEVSLLNNLGATVSHAVLLGTAPALLLETVLALFR